MKKLLVLASVSFCAATGAFASGFGLYQYSAPTHALGNTTLGKAIDGSANFINPATLTDLTNVTLTVGFITEHPRGRVRARQGDGAFHQYTMDPGFFAIPHFQLAVPLPADFTFGLGFGAEYGLGTRYNRNWMMNWSSRETTIEGLVLTPNLAYKITDKWSVGAGLRFLFFDFDQYSYPQAGQGGVNLGQFKNHLHGDNSFEDFGWQIGTKYDITETLSVGLNYKSQIKVKVRGRTSNHVNGYDENGIGLARDAAIQQAFAGSGYPAAAYSMFYNAAFAQADAAAHEQVKSQLRSAAKSRTGHAGADITLPQSLTGGINWDVTPDWHVGAMVSWTQWSKLDTLEFDLEGGDKATKLDWQDTWRAAVGVAWDFADDWTWMASYTYDMDSTVKDQESAMLPRADRHILATGLTWNIWENLELSLSYACIFMDGDVMHCKDAYGESYDLKTKWGFCHAGGFSATYRF